jgi:hypothetical protein
MHRPSTSTMSSSFHTHGLIGIDVHHVQAQRAVEFGTTVPGRSMWTGMRHALAALCITVGTMLAGEEVSHSTESQPAL